jgi:hypothetical protein
MSIGRPPAGRSVISSLGCTGTAGFAETSRKRGTRLASYRAWNYGTWGIGRVFSADTDTDTDSDTETDGDADTDADTNTNTNTNTDADADADVMKRSYGGFSSDRRPCHGNRYRARATDRLP